MMHGGMDSMMSWMMGIGVLGWVLVVALLVTMVVLLVRLISRRDDGSEPRSHSFGSTSRPPPR